MEPQSLKQTVIFIPSVLKNTKKTLTQIKNDNFASLLHFK